MAKRSVTKKGFNRAAISTTSREFHPCSFKAALPIACDALNARTVAVKACLPSMRVVARKLLTCFPSRCWSLGFLRRGKASWRTLCMARRKKDVPDFPYTASPLSCVAFFIKVLTWLLRLGTKRKRG